MRKPRRPGGLKDITEIGDVHVVPNNTMQFEWCCDCGLRHVTHYRVERGVHPSTDRVIVSTARDDWATEQMRKKC